MIPARLPAALAAAVPRIGLVGGTDGRTVVTGARLRVALPLLGALEVRAASRTDLHTGAVEAIAEGARDGVLVERLELRGRLPRIVAAATRRAITRG
jgi:hypothetical protein